MLIPSVIADSAKRTAIIKFLQWGLTKGQDYLEALSYARLPNAVTVKEEKAISKIKSSTGSAAQARAKVVGTQGVAVPHYRYTIAERD